MYERFLNVMQGQPPVVQKLERLRHQRIFNKTQLLSSSSSDAKKIIEVGVGTGEFCFICLQHGWKYTGVDRNATILSQIKPCQGYIAEAPPFPAEIPRDHYDVAYAAFVVEHLADGSAAYNFIKGMAELIKPDGNLVILVPDALSLGIEFWNLDYTHRFPTTERNITEIALDAGLLIQDVTRYRGPFISGLAIHAIRLAALCYRYRIFASLFGHKRFFYGLYQYLNQELLYISLKRPEGERIQA